MDCFKFLFLFQLLSLFKILNSLTQVNITEGFTKYFIEKGNVETFKFTAIDNGHYLFKFSQWAIIKEATGQIHQDVDKWEDFLTLVYAKKFVKGDYVKFDYPELARQYDDYFPITIKKLNNNINLRILSEGKSLHFETIFFDSCKKPLYLLLERGALLYPIYFKTIIHSAVFTAKYKTTDYTTQENEYINNNMENLNLNEIVQFPIFEINIVELKCQIPGYNSFTRARSWFCIL